MTDTSTLTQQDLDAIKGRQQATWASGDYAAIGTTLQLVGELLCEAVDIAAGSRVLDVAAGNGNASLAAARRGADVIATDYVGDLLGRAADRAKAEGLPLATEVADAENLPYGDGEFDTVLSTFGVMFTPNPTQSARELFRVCKPGGKIGLANWAPEGFIGSMFKVIGAHVPPPAGVPSPMLWGTDDALRERFADASSLTVTRRDFTFRYRSAEHFFETFRDFYGPTVKAWASLDDAGKASLQEQLVALAAGANRRTDGILAVPSTYVEVVITK